MSWEIVIGIIALIGVFGTVATWASKLSRSLSSLETTLKALDETLHELKDTNHESHKEFYKRLNEHDCRIAKLEGYDRSKNNPPVQ